MIYSYVLKVDNGSAPNPFWGLCTLTICKPSIRRVAKINDWIIGTGSKKNNNSNHIIYAMKVSDKKTIEEYDNFCKENLFNKIPNFRSGDHRISGDCIYDYSIKDNPVIRKSVHNDKNKKRDLSGKNSLLSNHFYYFGSNPVLIPFELSELIKIGPGHKKIESDIIINKFENWINKFELNKVYADPINKLW
jgi:hypothetical protein